MSATEGSEEKRGANACPLFDCLNDAQESNGWPLTFQRDLNVASAAVSRLTIDASHVSSGRNVQRAENLLERSLAKKLPASGEQ